MAKNQRRKDLRQLNRPQTKGQLSPRTTYSTSYKQEKVRWTAQEIDNGIWREGNVRWDMNGKESVDLLKFLDAITKLTWRECESARSGGHYKHHSQPVRDLPKHVQTRLQKLQVLEDTLFRFRLTGKCRLWGIRQNDLFRILWYDPDHLIYPVEKRHT